MYLDPNIARKNALQEAHLARAPRLPGGAPFFSHIEFSLCGLCNRQCVFCPRVDPEVYPNVAEFLSLEVYRKLLQELREVEYTGGLSYSGFSEPFYHKRLVEFVASSREILPECRVEIVTNGDFVKPQKLRALFAAGLNTLLISMYDGPEQVPHFQAIVEEAGVDPSRVILRKRYLSPEEQYGITLSNRAGTVSVQEVDVGPLREPLDHPCYYTHYRMMVDHNGDVLLCPHDWGKRLVAGNIHNEKIVDIWKGKILDRFRRRLGAGDRRFAPCSGCDVEGTRQGGAHFNAWREFYGGARVDSNDTLAVPEIPGRHG
jgi:radical SAM protein with 4Fe4S-binding SPASM domain